MSWETALQYGLPPLMGVAGYGARMLHEWRDVAKKTRAVRRHWKTEVLSAERVLTRVANMTKDDWSLHLFCGELLRGPSQRLDRLRPDLSLVGDLDIEEDLDEISAFCAAWSKVLTTVGEAGREEPDKPVRGRAETKEMCSEAAKLAKKTAARL